MSPRPFQQTYDNPAEKAWRSGTSPYSGTLGPNRTADPKKNTFAAEVRKNPEYQNFYSDRTFYQVAPQSEQKIQAASQTFESTFQNPGDKSFADKFLQEYSMGVARGLIEADKAVRPENLARLVTQQATEGSNERDPNTVNQFPGQNGVKV